MAVPIPFYLAPGEPIPEVKPTKAQVGYLLHKPYTGKKRKAVDNDQSASTGVPDSLREFVLDLATKFPKLQLQDEMGIIAGQQEDDMLSRLVDSNFDLSILP